MDFARLRRAVGTGHKKARKGARSGVRSAGAGSQSNPRAELICNGWISKQQTRGGGVPGVDPLCARWTRTVLPPRRRSGATKGIFVFERLPTKGDEYCELGLRNLINYCNMGLASRSCTDSLRTASVMALAKNLPRA